VNYQETKQLKPEDRIMKDLEEWYDGYCFSKNYGYKGHRPKVLNPVSTLESLRQKECDNYWSSTGSMDHVIERFYEDRRHWTFQDFKNGIHLKKSELSKKIDPLKVQLPLPVYMLLFGYATITNYNEKTKEVTIQLPNKEIECVIRDRLEEYVPSKKKFLPDCKKEIEMIFTTMNAGDVKNAMKLLREYDFVPISHPSADGVTSGELQRRMCKLFYDAGITYREGFSFKKDSNPKQDGGDIDFLTLNLNRNYAISLKCGKGGTALGAIDQMMKYLNENPGSFMEAMEKLNVNIEEIYIMGLSFTYEEGGQLRDWISVPFQNGKLQYEYVEADSEALRNKFLEKYTPDLQFSGKH
jgi:hypothetical protein